MNIGAHRVPICIVLQHFYKWGPAIGFPFVLMVSLLVRGTINADFLLICNLCAPFYDPLFTSYKLDPP